ncbi:MAG: phosphatidate cytidylyltransferase [Ferruginibacter sp.]|nr:phosphatidate cytidylyltransferase [Ferruginibacter sp.]
MLTMASDNLIKRTITGIALAAIIMVAISLSFATFILLIMVINLLGLLEFYCLFHSSAVIPGKIQGIVLSVCMLVTSALFITGKSNQTVLLINIPVAFGVFIAELFLKAENPFHNIAFTFLGIICITVPLCFFTAVTCLPLGQYQSPIALGYFFLLWASDTGAYFAGKYFGRHHLFERISPGKTWEGSFGGTASALLVACIAAHFFKTISLSGWIMMAVIIIVTGTFGDLIKSLMKRSLHLKDSGTILPGHGGMLDRFDSLLGSAPFVFCYLIVLPYLETHFIKL